LSKRTLKLQKDELYHFTSVKKGNNLTLQIFNDILITDF